MRRRTYLATTGALLASPLVGQTRASAETFQPRGTVSIEGTHDAVPGPEGQTAYVATGDGFATVDISDPANPTVLAERRELLSAEPGGPLEAIYDVKIDGDRLAVAGPANSGPELTGFLVYDVSDPADPEELFFYETNHPIHNLAFVDNVAYLTGNDGAENPLVAVDCSDDAPVEVGRWSLLDYDDAWGDVQAYLRVLHDVYVQDGRAYLAHWDAGTWIIDVSDPSAMSVVSRVRGRSIETLAAVDDPLVENFETPGNDHYVAVDEAADLLAVGAEAWDAESTDRIGGPGDIELYDISTPTDPQRTATITAPETPDPTGGGVWTTSHNFDLRNDRLYASWYRGGITVHDVSDPANPAEMVAWEDRAGASFFTAMATDNCVIASSIADPAGDANTSEGLFTFPIPTEDMASVTPEPTPTTTTTTPTPTTTITTDPSGGETSTTATPTESDATTPSSGSGSGPGFGGLSALVGLAAGGWYALRHRGRDDTE